MQVGAIDSNSFSIYDPYEIPAESLVIDNTPNVVDPSESVNGVEAVGIAINPIPEESIQLRELQSDIVTAFDDLREGNISREDFSNALEELGIELPQAQNGSETTLNSDPNNQNIQDLSSALVESVRGNANADVELSSYAAIMDIINKETQSPNINEQLQSYTQNLRN